MSDTLLDPYKRIKRIVIKHGRVGFMADAHWNFLDGSKATEFGGISILSSIPEYRSSGEQDGQRWVGVISGYPAVASVAFTPDDNNAQSAAWGWIYTENLGSGALESALLAALNLPSFVLDTDSLSDNGLWAVKSFGGVGLNSSSNGRVTGVILIINAEGLITQRMNGDGTGYLFDTFYV